MSLATMHDLLVHDLRDLYHAEGQVLKALPKMANKASNRSLVTALSDHLEQTERHKARLEECFKLLGVPARGKRCQGMEGLITEADEMAEEAANDEARDAAIIGACQKVEHYEISGYGTARAFAEKLSLSEVAALLRETLQEESRANQRLSEIAESEVNDQVVEKDGEPAMREERRSAERSSSRSESSRRAAPRNKSQPGSRRH